MSDLLTSIETGGAGWTVYLFLALVFATVVLVVVGATSLVGGRGSLRQRISAGAGFGRLPAAGAAGKATDEPGSLRFHDEAGGVGRILGPVAKRLVPTNLTDVSQTRLMLVHAGYMRPSAIGIYYVSRVVLALGLPLASLLFLPLAVPDLDSTRLVLVTAISGIVGLYLPNFWISRRTSSVQTQYRLAFPDSLDLLVICVEAGLGLDAAIARIGQELVGAHRRLGEQFGLLAAEMRAGASRRDALHNLSERLGIDEVRSMVTLLVQSEDLGTSIADALRVYSDEMRARRMLAAEMKANALSVKLSIPLALFVFPVIMTVIMLPVVIRVLRTLGKIQ